MSVFLNIRNPFIIELNWEKLSVESVERYKNLRTLDYEKEVINNSLLDEYRPSKRISKEIGKLTNSSESLIEGRKEEYRELFDSGLKEINKRTEQKLSYYNSN
mgnify:CR=1 FL=1